MVPFSRLTDPLLMHPAIRKRVEDPEMVLTNGNLRAGESSVFEAAGTLAEMLDARETLGRLAFDKVVALADKLGPVDFAEVNVVVQQCVPVSQTLKTVR